MQDKILAALSAAGGVATWPQLMDGLSAYEQQRALNEIRAMEKAGLVKRVVAIPPEGGPPTFTVHKVGG